MGEFLVLRSKDGRVMPRYLEHLMRSKPVIDAIDASTFGARMPRADWQFIGDLRMPLPGVSEQDAVVQYLEYINRRVRRYVRAKERLIGLLEEEKQAIINQAVTRGLDPSVRLKASGVEWVGDVPEHWEMSRVKSEFLSLNRRRRPLSAVERGAMAERRYDYYGASGVIDRVEDYLFDDELLLVAEDGANLVLRNLPLAIIARGKFWVNNHAHILKPRRGNLEYLAAVMESLNYSPWISGAAQPKLTQDRLMSIAIVVPPRSELGSKSLPTAKSRDIPSSNTGIARSTWNHVLERLRGVSSTRLIAGHGDRDTWMSGRRRWGWRTDRHRQVPGQRRWVGVRRGHRHDAIASG